jgi:hypothetical protein
MSEKNKKVQNGRTKFKTECIRKKGRANRLSGEKININIIGRHGRYERGGKKR